jgi:hypothetical protein
MQGVTVALYAKVNQKVLAGTSSNEKGAFNLKYSSKEKNILIGFSFIGYETKQIDTIDFLNNKADLGTILLKPSSIMKSAVEITRQKPMVEYYIDKVEVVTTQFAKDDPEGDDGRDKDGGLFK